MIRTLKVACLLSAILVVNTGFCAPADEAASEASIRTIMEVTHTKELLESAAAQLDGSVQSSMQQALAGQQISAEQQAILDEMRTKIVKLFGDALQWNQLEPVFIDIYRRTFTQSEIEGMLSFYKTDAGKALIAKMPLAMQNSMQAMQARMATIMPQVQQLQKETFEKLQATQQK